MSRRRTLGTLGAAAVAAGAVLAAPTLGTQANWYESKDTNAPAMRMGTINLGVTDHPVTAPWPATLQGTLTNNSGFGLEHVPTRLTLQPWPGSPTVNNDSTGFTGWNRGVAYDYSDCAGRTLWQVPLTDSTALPASYVVPGSRQPLLRGASTERCLTIKPDMTDYDRYDQFGGREFQLQTTFKAVSVASTWTSSATWTTRYVVPLPPAHQRWDGKVCTTDLASNVHLWWAWPDTTTVTRAITYSALDRWEVMARPAGTSQPFKAVVKAPGTDRDQQVDHSEMASQGYGVGDYDFIIRGYPFPSLFTKYTDSQLIYHARLVSVGALGGTSTWACDSVPATANPDSGMHGY